MNNEDDMALGGVMEIALPHVIVQSFEWFCGEYLNCRMCRVRAVAKRCAYMSSIALPPEISPQ